MTASMAPSRLCAAGLHMHCQDAGCGCPECHFTCAACAQRCRTLNGPNKDLCAGCARECADRRAHVEACERCGRGPAVRDPRDRRSAFLCGSCRDVELPRLPGVPVDLNAACAGLDAADDRHDFWPVRGRKEVCRACTMVRYVGRGYRTVYD